MEKFNNKGMTKIKVSGLRDFLNGILEENPDKEATVKTRESSEDNVLLELVISITENDDG
jgi:hypothetical protein